MRYNITLTSDELSTLKKSAANLDVPMSKLIKMFLKCLHESNADMDPPEQQYLINMNSNGASVINLNAGIGNQNPYNIVGGSFRIHRQYDEINNTRTQQCSITIDRQQDVQF